MHMGTINTDLRLHLHRLLQRLYQNRKKGKALWHWSKAHPGRVVGGKTSRESASKGSERGADPAVPVQGSLQSAASILRVTWLSLTAMRSRLPQTLRPWRMRCWSAW